jgi:hypothetical protein
MAKPNYRHLKKQRESTKKREQDSKRERRQAPKEPLPGENTIVGTPTDDRGTVTGDRSPSV